MQSLPRVQVENGKVKILECVLSYNSRDDRGKKFFLKNINKYRNIPTTHI